MNIIFMGTPDFSVPAFQELINSTEHNIVALFTQAPKAKGRGMKLINSPVHNLAIENDIPVYAPKTLRNEEALELIKSINADIIIVVAYGFIIPKNILNAKKYGCLNIHPSKLPKYRGAAPLQRTIINGEKESAVCIMQMDSGLDTGDIILQENFKLSPHITLLELHDQCANTGAKLLIKTLDNIDNLPRIKQFEVGLSYAHKLYKEEGRVNWKESSFVIDCKIRGMNPWPGVYFEHAGKRIKILSSEYTENNYKLLPGELSNNFEVTCGKGTLIIKYLKPAGKPKMLATDYFRGLLISNNKIIFS
jgi:methionyl-tRNA formyltransferase